MNDLIEHFLIEARELIEAATGDLLALEAAPGDREAVNRVFRAVHTLKGSVGLFDFPPMLATLHAAEDGLAAARAGALAVDGGLIDLSLDTLDASARWTEAIAATGRLPQGAGGEAARLAGRYRALLAPAAAAAPEAGEALPDWVAPLLATADPGEEPLTALRYRPRPDCYFSGDDPLGLVRRVPDLRALAVGADAPWPARADYDPFACNLAITLLSAAPPAELDALFVLVRDQVSLVPVPASARPAARAAPVTGLDAVTLAILVEQAALLAEPVSAEAEPGHREAAGRSAANALRAAGREADAADCLAAAGEGTPALVAIVMGLLSVPSAPAPPDASAAAPLDASAESAPETRSRDGAGEVARTLRVEAARVDDLVALAGDLVVARNGLGHLAAQAEAGADAAALARAIRDADAVLGRLVGALHRNAVSLRLLPVGQVFRRFARPVRELARDLGKAVDLAIVGEGTEADKAVVENLFEPLLHVLRNALDHGLEDAPARRRAGKPETGRIVLAARQDGDRVVVSVSDDGRGIDPEIVRRRAAQRGLRGPEALAGLDDASVIDLIFAPGFSTAERVSAVSGRGVGMDAVRAAAERLGGRVTVESRVGHGTAIHLILPQAVALTRILVVAVGGERHGIAMSAVSEVVRCPRARIQAVAGGRATVLRGRTVPVVALGDLLGQPDPAGPSGAAGDALLLVVHDGEGPVALAIDRVTERIEAVLRPPRGLLGTLPGIAGTTLLGDGRVLLVLDPAALLAPSGTPHDPDRTA